MASESSRYPEEMACHCTAAISMISLVTEPFIVMATSETWNAQISCLGSLWQEGEFVFLASKGVRPMALMGFSPGSVRS